METYTKEDLVVFYQNFTDAKMSQVRKCDKEYLADRLKEQGGWDLFLKNLDSIQKLNSLRKQSSRLH